MTPYPEKLRHQAKKEMDFYGLQFVIDRENFLRGWNARSRFDDEGNERENQPELR
jgi:hypothetical protein